MFIIMRLNVDKTKTLCYFLKPMTHLKVFLQKSLSKATFERKLSDVAYTLAQVFTCAS